MDNIKKFESYIINEYNNIISKKEPLDDKYIVTPKSREGLDNLLKSHKIDLSDWGKKKYKKINHLWNEIKEEETELYSINGKLRREVNFVGARIMYINGNDKFILFEEKAIFKGGRERIRSDIWYSMAEKFKYGEDHKEAIKRGMQEELGINISDDQSTFFNKLYFPENSDYPGLESFHTGYSYLVIINDEQYKEEGYVENQEDKDIFFKWRKV